MRRATAAVTISAVLLSMWVFAAASTACASPVAIEATPLSRATVDGTVVRNAEFVAIEDSALAIFGTLHPDEVVDAYSFVAAEDARVLLRVSFRTGLWLGEERPRLLLVPAKGRASAEGRPPAGRRAYLDFRSMERMRPAAEATAEVKRGEQYTVVLTEGVGVIEQLPYVIEIETLNDPVSHSPLAIGLPAAMTLWSGTYGQRTVRPLAVLLMFGVLVVVAALLTSGMRMAAKLVSSVGSSKRNGRAPHVTELPRVTYAPTPSAVAPAAAEAEPEAEQPAAAEVEPEVVAEQPAAAEVEPEAEQPAAAKLEPPEQEYEPASVVSAAELVAEAADCAPFTSEEPAPEPELASAPATAEAPSGETEPVDLDADPAHLAPPATAPKKKPGLGKRVSLDDRLGDYI